MNDRRKILDELAEAEVKDGLYHKGCSDSCEDSSHEICNTCGATRWEHNAEQWYYCQLTPERRELYNSGIQGKSQ